MNKFIGIAGLCSLLLLGNACRRQPATDSRNFGVMPKIDSTSQTVAVNPTPIDTTAKTASNAASQPNAARPAVAEVDFRYLTTRSKLSFKGPKQELDNANLTIRARKDSLIWLSVSKLGIEAVRTLITPDSIIVLDKLHKETVAFDFPTLSRQFNFRINFALLQSILLGNLPYPQQAATVASSSETTILSRQQAGPVLVENYISKPNQKLTQVRLTDQPTQNTLQVTYEQFTALATVLFPFTNLITLTYKPKATDQASQTDIQIRHNRVELSDTNPGFPFSVPASYQHRLN
ncbi:DUF4292 domain-containing protein [Spirosoma sp. KUDC1026]|uniref:DUF4292 domain-containing protein n=1 Tax=Spirosoma sp. KUDC1026 TaxID=2745947 RepID=UPI00159B973E|nr:DUF4292 domain-containing protein [Spirosoma sp. KUDC1026]QKZ11402.1 DUF4292 domain-containing protein [Spirosoma sp. KUDC1026]